MPFPIGSRGFTARTLGRDGRYVCGPACARCKCKSGSFLTVRMTLYSDEKQQHDSFALTTEETAPPMPHPSLTLVMPTISWEEPCATCLCASLAALAPQDEALVVFDGEPPPPPDWLLHSPVRLLSTGRRSGPASARNLAAREARGEILWFVDADVQVHPDAAGRIREHFADSPALAAVFGSYDDTPADPGLVSRFRNLLHHHTHSSHPGPACTFWAGLGAVRRQAFLDLGGFDAVSYDRPCIEDIEFGLRLSDAGGMIILDPAIQGTHHKRWTLRSMVSTDIRQRAIPWSQLLLRRRELPTTLNLDPTARLSAAASLLLPLALLVAAWMPALRPMSLALAGGCLALLLLLNRNFYGLLFRRGGPPEACVGIVLHGLVLSYSGVTFAVLTLLDLLQRPLHWPSWLQHRPALQGRLVGWSLMLLGLLAISTLLAGLISTWILTPFDLRERWAEWQLFADGIYPSAMLATPLQRSLPDFRTTVYLPWALPLFGPFFVLGGWIQGTWILHLLSLLSLVLIARIGWFSLRSFGASAGWLGTLAPLAIAGNFSALNKGQFSIICMGLISLQWLLLQRQRNLPAGLLWSLAMVKPQIGLTYALPFLTPRRLPGLLLGLGVLTGLSFLALHHTNVELDIYLRSWISVLPQFMSSSNLNAVALLTNLFRASSQASLMLFAGVVCVAAVLGTVFGRRNLSTVFRTMESLLVGDPLGLAGFCGVLGQLGFYHRYYDNLMLYPALLVVFRLALGRPRILEGVLAASMAASVWTPQRLLDALPGSSLVQSLIWILVGTFLVQELTRSCARDNPLRTS
ncbi:glycosyltransferase [Synechococcus sp. CBW1004]|uniref:glycosyltransferase n=1 Tax=Synechococcus sp. CBW1004 TaxID=1353136 RepID=UPI0018CDDB0D|nr:glycosyltransferase [Synechococcus sp. CBW1004]QPN63426.1 glycosyltransferase [Synechococcus sp. CBW1004]